MRVQVSSAILTASIALVAAALISGPAAAAGPTVTIADFAFKPATVTIVAGQAVTWQNTSSTQHTVTADDGSFDSGRLSLHDQFANVFAVPGRFTYHCSIHPSMHGTVIVLAAPPTATPNGTPPPTPPSGTLPPGFKTAVPFPTVTSTPAVAPATAAPSAAAGDAGGSSGNSLGGPALLALGIVILIAVAALVLLRRSRRTA